MFYVASDGATIKLPLCHSLVRSIILLGIWRKKIIRIDVMATSYFELLAYNYAFTKPRRGKMIIEKSGLL